MEDTRRTRELLELIREQNSLLAEMNKNLEQRYGDYNTERSIYK